MPHMTSWQEKHREIAFRKYSQTIERRDYILPDGRVEDYYIRLEDPGSCVLALTANNEVVTLEQYRPGPNAIYREIPGGKVEENEDIIATAKRELLEETGYQGDLLDWRATWQADAYTQMSRTIVIVKNCKKVAESRLDANEFGIVRLISIPDFVAQVRAGLLTDTAGAMLALDHLGLLL